MLAAVGHAQRLRIIAELTRGRVHVSELARRLQLSRPLLYMHLGRLETANLIRGRLELSDDGKAMKYYELEPFELTLTAATILTAIEADEAAHDAKGHAAADHEAADRAAAGTAEPDTAPATQRTPERKPQ